ncbi:tetraacyldisaccharide 4'-kinase [Paraglaciecola aestuariivivens]
MKSIDKIWYAPKWFHWPMIVLLLPLSLVFYLMSAIRRKMFRLGLRQSLAIPVPVIVVGNISVGGNGKTPLVVQLAQSLRQAGYYPGVLSRGYGGKGAHYPMTVDKLSSAAVVGDEAVLMRHHVNCPLVVDPIRSRGAMALVNEHKCNLIICDDGLQHYGLKRDLEIAVIDGQRRAGNGLLLPAGPLREGKWRLKDVDFIVVNGGQILPGEHLMSLESGQLVNVLNPNKTLSLKALTEPVTALAGIGNPQRFFNLLESKQVKLKQRISFVDHHDFEQQDIPSGTVLMTEKDAVKCGDIAHPDCWFLPVRASLSKQFEQQLLDKVNQCVMLKKHPKKEIKHGL